jgi:hypothetical protein
LLTINGPKFQGLILLKLYSQPKPEPQYKLVKGIFEFELNVTDAEGLFSKDTVQVTVGVTTPTNHPPVAHAGKDTIITRAVNPVMLDGSASTDPDNNIVSYAWKIID